MLAEIATFLVNPECEKEAIKILRDHVVRAKKIQGVILSQAYRSRTEPRRFLIFYEFTDQAALEAHRASRDYNKYILTNLYGMTEPESLVVDTYDPLTSRNVHKL
jgi:quinol monooxygenase YgiN